jgi:hypothetical protein
MEKYVFTFDRARFLVGRNFSLVLASHRRYKDYGTCTSYLYQYQNLILEFLDFLTPFQTAT